MPIVKFRRVVNVNRGRIERNLRVERNVAQEESFTGMLAGNGSVKMAGRLWMVPGGHEMLEERIGCNSSERRLVGSPQLS